MSTTTIDQINNRNVQLTEVLVQRINSRYTAKIIKEIYSGHDVEIYDGEKLVCYLETKVREQSSGNYDSALIDEFKGNYLKRKSSEAAIPCFVAQFYEGDRTIHLYKVAEGGAFTPDVKRDVKNCPRTSCFGGGRVDKNVYLLPFDSENNWTYFWLELDGKPVKVQKLQRQKDKAAKAA